MAKEHLMRPYKASHNRATRDRQREREREKRDTPWRKQSKQAHEKSGDSNRDTSDNTGRLAKRRETTGRRRG
jgi:hypothetical protein